MNKTVSVIIPVYNREAYIEECIQSILQQSYQDFEIILVDDGSTDSSFEICSRLASNDSRIKLFSLDHTGVSAARNKGIDESTGTYLFFIDSDDVIHPVLLEHLIAQLETHCVSIAATRGLDVQADQWDNTVVPEMITHKSFEITNYYTNENLIQFFFSRNSIFGRMGGILFRRDYVDTTRFNTDLQIGEDICFVYENILKGSAAVVLEEKGYFWRWHSHKTSLDTSFSGFISRFRCCEFLWQNEEKFCRTQNANFEKCAIRKTFLAVQARNPLFSKESKMIRKFMRQYESTLLPAWSSRQKLSYWIAIYTPWLYFISRRIIVKMRKLRKLRKK